MSNYGKVVAYAGGVGGAKLATGLDIFLEDGELSVIVNTADDFTLHGLHISPDVDTVMYNLAGISDPKQGWGIKNDTNEALKIFTSINHDNEDIVLANFFLGISYYLIGDNTSLEFLKILPISAPLLNDGAPLFTSI